MNRISRIIVLAALMVMLLAAIKMYGQRAEQGRIRSEGSGIGPPFNMEGTNRGTAGDRPEEIRSLFSQLTPAEKAILMAAYSLKAGVPDKVDAILSDYQGSLSLTGVDIKEGILALNEKGLVKALSAKHNEKGAIGWTTLESPQSCVITEWGQKVAEEMMSVYLIEIEKK